MPPEHEALLILTREQFPELAEVPCEVEVILKGASDRHFYRLKWQDGREPMILMVYTLVRRDNPKFVPATLRLKKIGVHVPQIFASDDKRLCVWLEDLGRVDLQSLNDEPWEMRRPLYEATLREASKFHGVGEKSLPAADCDELEPVFDEALYEWEQNYFLDHFVGGHLGRDLGSPEFAKAQEVLKKLRHHLAKLPPPHVVQHVYVDAAGDAVAALVAWARLPKHHPTGPAPAAVEHARAVHGLHSHHPQPALATDQVAVSTMDNQR